MVFEYASLRGTLDGMDPTAITDIANYFHENMGYDIPPMTPFVGKNFNITRAGIHADGMMKDQEIYNIFDTEKLLGRKPAVLIGKTSGLAGIAYWINEYYHLPEDRAVTKKSEVVIKLKTWIDEEYAGGRQTMLTPGELDEKVREFGAL
jgi:isopropylmalate/homocitrate/citramalate synthase